jgi:ATP-dependent Clp protease ATP-binding subunit ClpA
VVLDKLGGSFDLLLRSYYCISIVHYFPPSSRFDEQVVFHKLDRGHVRQITSLMLKEVQKRVQDLNRGLTLWVSGRPRACLFYSAICKKI